MRVVGLLVSPLLLSFLANLQAMVVLYLPSLIARLLASLTAHLSAAEPIMEAVL